MGSLNVAGKKRGPKGPRKVTFEVLLWIEAEIRAGHARKNIVSDMSQKFGIGSTLAKETIREMPALMKDKEKARAHNRKVSQTHVMLERWVKGPWRPR